MKNLLQTHKTKNKMKTKLLFIAIIVHLNCFSQTSIPGGNISGVWTLAGSPYNIQGNNTIPNDSTLTIEAGVTVNFQGQYNIVVLGRLLAIGSATDTITFTAANTTDGWRGIRFDGITNNNDTSRFYYCKLQYGKANAISGQGRHGGAFYFNLFSKAIISNCLITNCVALDKGGAIWLGNSASIIISNNTISNNYAATAGGGISSNSNSCTISNNIISYNTAANYDGGGISCNHGSQTITGNTIFNNSAYVGGGLYSESASPNIYNNTISNNSAYQGGGLKCDATPFISKNIISGNTADYGGGIHCMNSTAIISYNTISNNLASSYYGGGIFLANCSPTISNNTITNNSANINYGGGIYCNYSFPTISNNTIVNNSAVKGGSLYCCNAAVPTFQNCVLWGNTASMAGAVVYLEDVASQPNFYYCDVQGDSVTFEGISYTGTYSNNIDTDPLFVAPSGGSGTSFNGVIADWSLLPASPCIEGGEPSGTYPSSDKAGNIRVSGCIIDMGPYEYQKGFTPPLPFSQSPVVCAGQSVTVGSNTYTMNGTYTDILTSMHGCDSTVTTNLTVNPLPAVSLSFPSNVHRVCLYDGNVALSGESPTNGTYSGTGVSGTSFNPVTAGVGTHTIIYTYTDVNGCVNTATDTINVDLCTGINEPANNNLFSIYPNPTNGPFTIVPSAENTEIIVTDILGQRVIITQVTQKTLDLQLANNGVYIVYAKTKQGTTTQKLIVHR